MRFRATIAAAESSRHEMVCGVLATLERLESGGKREKRRGAIVLSHSGMQIAVIPERATEDMLAFATFSSETFAEFRVQSLADDHIYLVVWLESLSKALASSSGNATRLRLSKTSQGTPCLVVEFQDISRVSHQVPVRVVSKEDVAQYEPPTLPSPAFVLELPRQHKAVKTVVDRLKNIGDRANGDARYVDAKLEHSGTLSLRISTDAAVIKTFFSDLSVKRQAEEEEEEPIQKIVRLRVDCRKLAQTLHAYNLPFTSISCCPVSGIALIFHVFLLDNNLGNLTFYLPAIDDDAYDDEDDDES